MTYTPIQRVPKKKRGAPQGARGAEEGTRGPRKKTRVGAWDGRFCSAMGCAERTASKLPFCAHHWLRCSTWSQNQILQTGSMHHTRHDPAFFQAIECGIHDLTRTPCPCGKPHWMREQ